MHIQRMDSSSLWGTFCSYMYVIRSTFFIHKVLISYNDFLKGLAVKCLTFHSHFFLNKEINFNEEHEL